MRVSVFVWLYAIWYLDDVVGGTWEKHGIEVCKAVLYGIKKVVHTLESTRFLWTEVTSWLVCYVTQNLHKLSRHVTLTNSPERGGRLGSWSSSCSISIIVVWHSSQMHTFTYHASTFRWFQSVYLARGHVSNCFGRHTTVSKGVWSITHKYSRGWQWMECYL